MHDIFIAHSREQKVSIAIPLTETLRNCGFSVWLDCRFISMGAQIFSTIDSAIDDSFMGIAIVSKEFLNKVWPMHELRRLYEKCENSHSNSLLLILHNLVIDDVTATISHFKGVAYERCDSELIHERVIDRLLARIVDAYFGLKQSDYNQATFMTTAIELEKDHRYDERHKRMLISLIKLYTYSYDDVRSKLIALYNLIGYIKGVSEKYLVGDKHAIEIAFRYINCVQNKAIPSIENVNYDQYVASEKAVLFSLSSINSTYNG